MPDDAHDLPEQVLAAARDDLTAFRPDRTPPFSALQARKRRRDARRGGTALAATALAVAGVAFVPATLTGGAGPAPGQVATGPQDDRVLRYSVGIDGPEAASPASAAALDRCLSLPGLSSDGLQLDSDPPQYAGTVVGQARADDFAACVEAVPGRSATLTPVAQEQAEQPDDGPPVAWTGAQVCVQGDVSSCRDLGRDQARALYARLEATAPEPPGPVHCSTESQVYVVTFTHPSVKPVPFEVPYLCAPMTVGSEVRLLDQADRDAVRRAHETGDPDDAARPTPDDGLTPEQRAFVAFCTGTERPLPAADHVGLTEQAATAAYGPSTRVVGRDGQCLGRTLDHREDRVNLVVEDGAVVWAGRF